MVRFIDTTARYFTDWRSSSEIDRFMKRRAGVRNNTEYRAYLQNNAEALMKDQRNTTHNRVKRNCTLLM